MVIELAGTKGKFGTLTNDEPEDVGVVATGLIHRSGNVAKMARVPWRVAVVSRGVALPL